MLLQPLQLLQNRCVTVYAWYGVRRSRCVNVTGPVSVKCADGCRALHYRANSSSRGRSNDFTETKAPIPAFRITAFSYLLVFSTGDAEIS